MNTFEETEDLSSLQMVGSLIMTVIRHFIFVTPPIATHGKSVTVGCHLISPISSSGCLRPGSGVMFFMTGGDFSQFLIHDSTKRFGERSETFSLELSTGGRVRRPHRAWSG
jgi:hypothetical protein